MMIQRKIMDDVGFLDESYFLYGEDLDWCYRIREKGWKVRYSPDNQIIHFKGESSKRSQFDNLRVFYHAMVLFVQKHFKHKYLLMPYWILLGAIWFRAGLSFLKKILVTLTVPATDFVLLTLSLVLGVYIRFGSFAHLPSFIPVDIAYSFIWMATLYLFGCHDKHKFSSLKAGSAIVIGFLFNASLTFFFKQYAFSRAVVLYASLLSLVVVPGWRLIIKLLPQLGLGPFKGTLGKTLLGRKAVIVGDFKSGEKLLNKFNSQIDVGYDIAGLISINGADTGSEYQGMKVLGSVDELSSIIREEKIQEVIFSTHRLSYDKVMDIISRSKSPRVNFKLVPSNLEVIIGKASIDRIDDMPLLEIDYKLHQDRYRLLKRSLDFILALVGGILFLPVFLYKKYLTSAKLTKRIVHGSMNGPISIYEFESNHSSFFDKIPYVWSILRGDLSFVGSEIEDFSENSEHLSPEKFVLMPGLTGLVQVNRHRHLSQEDKEKYHLYYMKNYSPFLDLEIIFKALFKL
jgi:lipopolysaccharide/colanic/teichoic acid biosynthesis glycosyltransferase